VIAVQFPLRPIAFGCLCALLTLAASAQTETVTPAAATADTASGTLATVTVESSADASAGGLPKPFAGGQVSTGSRIGVLGNQSIMDTPFQSTSYTSQLIQDQQAQSVADVLQNDPSVRTARGFGNFQELYVIRGFPVYSDDIGDNGLSGLLPRQYIASELFERVEVFRGASAFLNGAAPGGSGLGGAINLVPKRASNDPLTQVSVGVQSGGEASASADISRRFGPDDSTGIRVNAVKREGNDGIDDEKRDLTAVGVGLDWRSRDVRVSADIGYQDFTLNSPRPNVTPATGLPIPSAPDAQKNFAQPWTYGKETDTFGTLRAEYDINDHLTGWVAGGVREGKESNSVANPTITDALGNTVASRFDNVRKDSVSTGEVGLRGTFDTGAVKHTVTASAAAFQDDLRNAYAMSGSTILSNIYVPVASAPPLANFFTGGTLGDPMVTERVKTSSFAVADTMSFMQDRLLLTIGARHQTIEDNSYDYDSGLETGSYKQSKTTPVAGIVFKATPEVSLYGNYIEGLQKGDVAPAFTSNNLPVTNAGQVFAPFTAKQGEIGAKYQSGTFGATAAVFQVTQPQAFVVNQTFGTFGEQRNRGVELSLYGEPVRGLRLLGGVSFIDAEQVSTPGGLTDGKDAIGVPRQQLNIGVDWDVPGVQGLALNALYVYTGKQYADAANTQSLPSWNRVDVGVRYLMDIGNGRLLTLRARVNNLFNSSYWASAGGYPGSNYLVLGAPRTFVLSGTINF
jgi:iron complex outermembrane receptor protein